MISMGKILIVESWFFLCPQWTLYVGNDNIINQNWDTLFFLIFALSSRSDLQSTDNNACIIKDQKQEKRQINTTGNVIL